MKLEDLIRKTFSLKRNFKVVDGLGPGRLDGWDSLGHLNLIMAIEKKYKIKFSTDEMISIDSIGEIRRLLKGKKVKTL